MEQPCRLRDQGRTPNAFSLLSRGSDHIHDLSSFCVSLEDRMFLETSAPPFQLMAWDLLSRAGAGSSGWHDGEVGRGRKCAGSAPSQHRMELLRPWHSKGQGMTKDADRESWNFRDTRALGTSRPQSKGLWGPPQAP